LIHFFYQNVAVSTIKNGKKDRSIPNRRQTTSKGGSCARRAFHGYGALQAIQDFFYDHQPQTRSFFHELFGIGRSEKFRKETGDIICGDAD